jgi:hypothetical protein
VNEISLRSIETTRGAPGKRLAVGGAREDPVPGGEPDARDLVVVEDVVRGVRAATDLDVVVVARQEAVLVEVQRLLGAVGGEIARPDDAQASPVLPAFVPPSSSLISNRASRTRTAASDNVHIAVPTKYAS